MTEQQASEMLDYLLTISIYTQGNNGLLESIQYYVILTFFVITISFGYFIGKSFFRS